MGYPGRRAARSSTDRAATAGIAKNMRCRGSRRAGQARTTGSWWKRWGDYGANATSSSHRPHPPDSGVHCAHLAHPIRGRMPNLRPLPQAADLPHWQALALPAPGARTIRHAASGFGVRGPPCPIFEKLRGGAAPGLINQPTDCCAPLLGAAGRKIVSRSNRSPRRGAGEHRETEWQQQGVVLAQSSSSRDPPLSGCTGQGGEKAAPPA